MNGNLNTGIGVLTLAKYHHNKDIDSTNRIVTRTLGKFGIISKDYKGTLPKEDEFWLTRIIDNIKPDEKLGCFIVEPIKKIEYSCVGKLLVGMYDEVPTENKCLAFIKPHDSFKNNVWQLTLEDRKNYKSRAVIVLQDECLLGDNSNEQIENN